MNKVTLADVAKHSGLSRATIDRVVNKRGKVKSATVEMVHQAMYDCGYLLKPGRSADKHKAQFQFDFIFPKTRTRYFEYFDAELIKLEGVLSRFKVNARTHIIDGLNPSLLAETLKRVGQQTDGIAFVALDHPKVRLAVDALYHKGVATVSLVSDITGSKRLAYVGIDNRAAGRTAGLLMGQYLAHRKHGKIAVFTGSHSYRGHEEREAGFKSMMREKFSQYDVIVQPEAHDDDDESYNIALNALSEQDDLVGIYNVGGGTPGIIKRLKEVREKDDLVMIAHELNEQTKAFLVDGVVDIILNQNIRQELFNAVEILLNYQAGDYQSTQVRQPAVEVFLPENLY
ncbi:LacI family DNA-binding transcriptional regulator [Ningiella sp. W23]|uniref:LacI family DNA-binding transcriptional regulator n=1 Tax=Ningiella sp. W23 TaxID=3023715 RepID=UPI0037568BB2